MYMFFYRLLVYVLPLETQLLRREDQDPINRFKPAIFVCLFQARTWIVKVIWRGIFMYSVSSVKMSYECSFC